MGLVLCLFAIAIRLPYLDLVPRWSAGNENSIALAILEGSRPLTNQNPHLGALSPYLVALALAVFGFHSWVPRLVPFLFAIATVLVTWRLGIRMGSVRTGVIAAVLMSSAWYHVVFNSHYPWSNSLTPFFATAFLLVISRFLDVSPENSHSKQTIISSLLAGLLFGMGLQTHPEMVTLLPVIILVLILSRGYSRGLRNPVPWLMFIGGATGYINMLWYNVLNRFKSVEFGLTYPEYALTKEYTATFVIGNYFHEFLYLPRIIFGLHDDTISWSNYAGHPMIWLFWILLISGIVIVVRERRYLIPASFLSCFLIIPAINSNYSLNLGRYLVFMFPTALILISETLNRLMSLELRQFSGRVLRAGVLAVLVLLVLYPLLQVRAYYGHCETHGLTRERYHRLDEIIQETGLEHPLIILDKETGEGNDFHQYLREEGYTCHFERFRDKRGDYININKIRSKIGLEQYDKGFDGVILVLAPWNRRYLLNQLNVNRFLGQIDAWFDNELVDFYRVYQLNS